MHSDVHCYTNAIEYYFIGMKTHFHRSDLAEKNISDIVFIRHRIILVSITL